MSAPCFRLPSPPALIVLVGAFGSGKSTWARQHFTVAEVVFSDALRAVVGTGEGDLDASEDAFAILDAVVAARTRRGLTTVIDTLGLDPVRRQAAVELGRAAGLPVVAVRFDTDLDTCRRRNRTRDRPVAGRCLALMDHLLQLPQVGRAWHPIPEAYVASAF